MRRVGLSLMCTAVCFATLCTWSVSFATTSSSSVSTPFGGNGHNVSFDGRLFVVRRGADDPSGGWFATLLRPENIVFGADTMPQFGQGAFSTMTLIQPFAAGENALALCEPNPAPYACDEAGNSNPAGPRACYDLQVIDSNAYADQVNQLRMRSLKLWVSSPGTANAEVHKWEWGAQRSDMSRAGGGQLRGIEPTVSKDGRLLVWQGHPNNDGAIDILMYATNQTACGQSGWDGPHNLGSMFTDPKVHGVYPIGERALRAADGSVFGPNDMFRGAYPWLFPDGEAVNFTSITVPCRAQEDPPGCGPRRGGLAVIGYPTNWSLAHIDGGANPDTDQTVRLFFSSPGPNTFAQIPVTPGVDVWPMFGSNTQNYVEFVFDDGLDGRYGGVWHMNEMVDRNGDVDLTRTPDVSGYFNTAEVRDAVFPSTNIAPRGKALLFDGVRSHLRIPHDPSLDPVNAITIEMRLRLDADPDCDANNNYRYLLGKGNAADGSYTVMLEESRQLHARVNVGGEQRSLVSTAALPIGAWAHVLFTYSAATGQLAFTFDDVPAGEATFAPGTLAGSSAILTIGGPGGARDACPNGDGAFLGAIDEVRILRSDDANPDPDPGLDPDPNPGMDPDATPDAGAIADSGGTASDAGGSDLGIPSARDTSSTGTNGGGSSLAGEEGCSCATAAPSDTASMFMLFGFFLWRRRR